MKGSSFRKEARRGLARSIILYWKHSTVSPTLPEPQGGLLVRSQGPLRPASVPNLGWGWGFRLASSSAVRLSTPLPAPRSTPHAPSVSHTPVNLKGLAIPQTQGAPARNDALLSPTGSLFKVHFTRQPPDRSRHRTFSGAQGLPHPSSLSILLALHPQEIVIIPISIVAH